MLEDKEIFKPLIVKIAKKRKPFTLVLYVDAGSSLKYAVRFIKSLFDIHFHLH